ncbi:MAG TPA: hypothetical protein VKF38_16670 [Anaerolineaceae bacterium]|nr:hypothetical protein [Anaerolineaceae bacterium]
MNNLKVWHWAGVFGLATVVFWLSQFPLYMAGSPPSVYDGAAYSRYLFSIQNISFTRILLDLGGYVTSMVFAAMFAQLIRQARPEYEWVATLIFGAMAVWIGVTLVANGLEGGAVLDTLSGKADPSAVRGLTEGTLLIYNGSIAFALTGLFLGAVGYATLATRLLPGWTGWIAIVGALLCALSVPAMYGGPVNYAGFYNAGGWGPVITANFPPVIWFLSASLLMLRKH